MLWPVGYYEIFEQIPAELRGPLMRLFDALRQELGVRREEYEALRTAVRDLTEVQKQVWQAIDTLSQRTDELAAAQKRTEERVEELAAAQKRTEERLDALAARVEELAAAQKRTEERLDALAARVEELAAAQKRTEERVEELAAAQKRTEERLEELALAQKRTDERVDKLVATFEKFQRTFHWHVSALGARWGIRSERAFRSGMRAILRDLGYTVERFITEDKDGAILGFPTSVELDIIVRDGTIIVAEIKSSASVADVAAFFKKAAFYERQSGKQVHKKLFISPYVEKRARKLARELGIELCTDINSMAA
ncbi:MAG: hypothetical protein C4296_03790 [Gemmataceae bacterium]